MVRPSSADINTAQPIKGNYPQKMSAKSAHFGVRVHGEQEAGSLDLLWLAAAGHNGIWVHATTKSR